MQKQFLSSVLGGPVKYEGRSMVDAHKNLDLNDSHVDAIIELLGQTLKELNIDEALIKEVIVVAESVRRDVLSSKYKKM